jgi:hypothetical protein
MAVSTTSALELRRVFGPGAPPVFHPGETGSVILNVDTSMDQYFSFLSMAIPSNDAFIGNEDAMAHQIVMSNMIQSMTIDIMGSMLYDAGTEVNDEIAANVPLLGQAAPDTGDDEGGLVGLHSGFLGAGPILTAFPGAGSQGPLARIKIEAIPAPGSLALLSIGALMLRRKRLMGRQLG